jgi:3-oxoadipate enol-lactonase
MLSCTDQGTGHPVVLLHAFPLSRQMWEDAVKVWSARYRVLAPDLPGFGDSPSSRADFTMEGCARELSQFLMDRDVHEKIALVGLSMGGYIAFEFIRQFPGRISGLVLAATHPLPDTEAAAKGRRETAEFVLREGGRALSERLLPKLLGATTLGTKPAVIQKVQQLIVSNSPEAIAQACLGLASRRDSTPVLQEIRVPTLIVAGSEDALIPETRAVEMKQQITTAELEVFLACGHLINLEQPQLFQERVLSFLKIVS